MRKLKLSNKRFSDEAIALAILAKIGPEDTGRVINYDDEGYYPSDFTPKLNPFEAIYREEYDD